MVRIVNLILLEVFRKGASDVHLEPFENRLRVRYRVDGVLEEAVSPPRRMQPAICARLKILARLDIAEHRLA